MALGAQFKSLKAEGTKMSEEYVCATKIISRIEK